MEAFIELLERHDKLANWLSALGTILAVATSVWFARKSERHAREAEERSRIDRDETKRIRAEQAAREEEVKEDRRRSQAVRIHAFPVSSRKESFVRYINTSDLPATNLRLWLARRDGRADPTLRLLWNLTPTGEYSLKIDFDRFNKKISQGPKLIDGDEYFPLALEFTDGNGVSWRRTSSSKGVFELQEISSIEPVELNPDGTVVRPLQPFPGWEKFERMRSCSLAHIRFEF